MPGSGFTDRYLTADETRSIVAAGLASLSLAGKRVLVIIPDDTRRWTRRRCPDWSARR